MQPIFVIGRHRSGTTWVANILAAHPSVFTPEHEAHQGQHESAFFSSLLPYCRMGVTEPDRRAISAIFERSDFWHLLFPSNSPRIDIETTGVERYFSGAMDEAARRRACTHWVEKTPGHTLVLQDLLERFPEAKFIAVQRSWLNAVRSNVYKFGDPDKVNDWVKAAIWSELYSKIIRLNGSKLFFINYEALLRDFEEESRNMFDYVGLADDAFESTQWAPDSSYSGKPPAIQPGILAALWLVRAGFFFVPATACQKVARAWVRRRAGVLPAWFFRVYRGAKTSGGE
jgi:hypothetical protein